MTPLIELCVEGVDGAVTAAEAGADRIELCASLLEGGLTPSLGTLRATLAAVSIPVAVMVRPRGGDFLYSEREFASMLDDVARFRDEGAACVVFGLSAGNLLTLPSLVIQREFEAASFGMLVGLSWAVSQFTYAFGPGLLGVIRDVTGNYTAPLILCAALDLAAAALILLRPAKG